MTLQPKSLASSQPQTAGDIATVANVVNDMHACQSTMGRVRCSYTLTEKYFHIHIVITFSRHFTFQASKQARSSSPSRRKRKEKRPRYARAPIAIFNILYYCCSTASSVLAESGQVYLSCARIPGSLLFSFSTRGTARPCLLACLLCNLAWPH